MSPALESLSTLAGVFIKYYPGLRNLEGAFCLFLFVGSFYSFMQFPKTLAQISNQPVTEGFPSVSIWNSFLFTSKSLSE